MLAQSVFSHTFRDLTLQGFAGVTESLADRGLLFATFFEREHTAAGSGWRYPACVPYPWDELVSIGAEAGLSLSRIEWPHPRQTWFVAAHDRAAAEAAAARIASS